MRKLLRKAQKHKHGRAILYSIGAVGLAGIFASPQIIAAATDCSFSTTGVVMVLNGDCTTDSTILVPDGMTLDGQGHTITAVDPAGGHFVGAVIKNGGSVAYVTNVSITTDNLADICDSGADRLRGILFEGASGSITGVTVMDINQGTSGCQEGNGIEVRNEPFATGGNDKRVIIEDNTVINYQKTGIIANGSVAATIRGNSVGGFGPINFIAQNGIQVAFGGTATVEDNNIRGNDYAPKDWISCGILMFDADGVRAGKNKYGKNEINFCNFGARNGGQSKPSAI